MIKSLESTRRNCEPADWQKNVKEITVLLWKAFGIAFRRRFCAYKKQIFSRMYSLTTLIINMNQVKKLSVKVTCVTWRWVFWVSLRFLPLSSLAAGTISRPVGGPGMSPPWGPSPLPPEVDVDGARPRSLPAGGYEPHRRGLCMRAAPACRPRYMVNRSIFTTQIWYHCVQTIFVHVKKNIPLGSMPPNSRYQHLKVLSEESGRH